MENGGKVIFIGDGRYDSMGFSAYYCTYVIMVSVDINNNFLNIYLAH